MPHSVHWKLSPFSCSFKCFFICFWNSCRDRWVNSHFWHVYDSGNGGSSLAWKKIWVRFGIRTKTINHETKFRKKKTYQFFLCRFFSHISHWDWSFWSHQNRSSRCWQCVGWCWDVIIVMMSAHRIWNRICRNRILSDFCLYHIGCDIIYVMDLEKQFKIRSKMSELDMAKFYKPCVSVFERQMVSDWWNHIIYNNLILFSLLSLIRHFHWLLASS